jgi:hypothetical protein
MYTKGDLGFLPNSTARVANRNFFGSPGHPSKKGAVGLSQVSKMVSNDESSFQTLNQSNTNNNKTELAETTMIGKRTDWLESQERKLTATLSETRSDTNSLHTRIETLSTLQEESSKDLYEEMQSIFGKVTQSCLKTLPRDVTIEGYIQKPSQTLENLDITEDQWIMLVYPMKRVHVDKNHTQSFMRYKHVDEFTGQLSLHWVMIHEDKDDSCESRYISQFSLRPS